MYSAMAEQIWLRFPEGGSPLVLMLALGRAVGDDGTCEISMSQLATVARMSRSSVWRVLGELQQAGWIVADRTPGRAGVYRVQVALGKIGEASPMMQSAREEEVAATSVPICNTPNGDEHVPEPKSLPSLSVAAETSEPREVPDFMTFRPGLLCHSRLPFQTDRSSPRRRRQPW